MLSFDFDFLLPSSFDKFLAAALILLSSAVFCCIFELILETTVESFPLWREYDSCSFNISFSNRPACSDILNFLSLIFSSLSSFIVFELRSVPQRLDLQLCE